MLRSSATAYSKPSNFCIALETWDSRKGFRFFLLLASHKSVRSLVVPSCLDVINEGEDYSLTECFASTPMNANHSTSLHEHYSLAWGTGHAFPWQGAAFFFEFNDASLVPQLPSALSNELSRFFNEWQSPLMLPPMSFDGCYFLTKRNLFFAF